ncbi:MAG: DUF4388 domain-containing protein [candidate division Zixibacteria bacterium]|nr:DUF4388 domain-containing protein [candidate division Zixibacteria bacterium]
MSLSGNLRTVSFPDILQLLATGKKTGILECKTSSRQKEVAFRDGNIIYASSVNASEDLLGNMLLKRGKLSKADLERAITLHKQTGRQLGTTLIDMDLFDKEEIGIVLKMQIEEIVYNLFSWREGEFIFHENAQPRNAPFVLDMDTMNVIMEGTRRIDEWTEIQKVLPPDDALFRIAKAPKSEDEDISLSVDEFRMLSLINGERTLPELLDMSPMGEFVTCRAFYRLIVNGLIEVAGTAVAQPQVQEDEEEVALSIIFTLYNSCFWKVRAVVDEMLGENNTRYASFLAQYRSGLTVFFPGVEPHSELAPSFDKFLATVRSMPQATRYYTLMSALDRMLTDQLVFIYDLLGTGTYRESINRVKREITGPLAQRRELVQRFGIEDTFYNTIKRADKVVKLVRG